MKNKKLSIVIVNLNGWKYLEALLKSILGSKTKDYEVIIVDNGSTNDCEKIDNFCSLDDRFKSVKLHKNVGPAMARNIGVANTTGKYISFLDNDTLVDKNWATEAINYFNKHKKVGIIQCKLLLESDHNKIDYVGEYLGTNGFLVQECSAGTIDNGQFNKPKKILAAKSAGMFIKREAFNRVGGFDDDYFIYVEETDLGWRSWIAGFEAHFLPSSVVYHHFGTSSVILGSKNASSLAKYHGPKNYLMTLLKNSPSRMLPKIIFYHFLLWVGFIFFRLFTFKIGDSFEMTKGILYFLFNVSSTLKKRHKIQNDKVKSKQIFLNELVVSRSLWYFVSKAVIKRKVGNANSY
jgi:GT2 family glycosyltransferase